MRPITPAMQAHYARSSHTPAAMLRLDLKDGAKIGFTDHDIDLPFDLGDGEVTFLAGEGILPSDLELSEGLEAGNFEVRGPIGQTVTREHIMGGRYRSAIAWLFEVNWADLTAGYTPLTLGFVSQARVEGGAFIIEVRTEAARFEQVVGALTTPQCRTYYGSPLCGKVRESVDAVVTAVTDEMLFTVGYDGDFPDGYFDQGTVSVLEGPLLNTDEVDIHKWLASGAIEMFTGFVERLAVGDTVRLFRGCPRARTDCMARDNILNFRGEPDMTGSDVLLRPTLPGQVDQ
jgi:uncharacterized phage protein (TIGR02218 family)